MTRRRNPRYELRVPLEIVSVNGQPKLIKARTHDISTGGVRCYAKTSIPAGAPVEYKVALSNNLPAIIIQCKGTVLRNQLSTDSEYPFELVFSMQRYLFAPQQPNDSRAKEEPPPGEPTVFHRVVTQ